MKLKIIFGTFFVLISSFSFSAIKKPDVIVEIAKNTELEKKITFPGVTKSQKQSTLLAETSGVIRKIKKQLGQPVLKGEILASIENPDPVYQFKPLAIRSPISGKLTKSLILEGGNVEKGMPLFTITDPHSIIIEVQIPARDVNLLKIGSTAFFTSAFIYSEAMKDDHEKKEVKLVGLSPSPDLGTLTAVGLFEFTKEKDKGLPGIQGFVHYTASSKRMILLPESILVRKSDKIFIRKFLDGKMKLEEIKVGDRFENQVEITAGLKEGDEYISRTSQHIKDGDEVQKTSNKSTKE